MNTQPWFELNYRDKSFEKYVIRVHNFEMKRGGIEIPLYICHNGLPKYSFSILFRDSLLRKYFSLDKFDKNKLGAEGSSLLIENLVRDIIFEKRLEDLKDKEIMIHVDSDYSKSIFYDNGCLNFHRDPTIVAKENRFAREIVLRELYKLNSQRGATLRAHVARECHFYTRTVDNAIDALMDRKFVASDANYNMSLTYSGLSFVEDNFLLSPFHGEIFMIGACKDEIFKLKERVYEPAAKKAGYKLKFQEQSEPRNTIHEDIWERIDYSKIILCDLTFKRPNCLIEYGYALAKGKHIILCVEETEGKSKDGLLRMPFDTLTQKYSFWRKEWLSNDKHSNDLMNYHNTILDRIREKLNIINAVSGL